MVRVEVLAEPQNHCALRRSACGAWDAGVLGGSDPLEKGMASHSSILAWRTPWTEEPDGLQSMVSQSDMTEATEPTGAGELPWLPKQIRATWGHFVPDVQTVQVKDKILHTIIKYGWKAPGSSSQMSGDRPEDISHIFVLKDKFHTHFGRDASVWSGVYHGATRTGHLDPLVCVSRWWRWRWRGCFYSLPLGWLFFAPLYSFPRHSTSASFCLPHFPLRQHVLPSWTLPPLLEDFFTPQWNHHDRHVVCIGRVSSFPWCHQGGDVRVKFILFPDGVTSEDRSWHIFRLYLLFLGSTLNIYIYIYIHTHTHMYLRIIPPSSTLPELLLLDTDDIF